jgi:CBS domain containing-hemolysin-like protein
MDQLFANALKLLGVITLVFLNGFFVAAEFAFVKLRDTQLEPLIVRGHRRARIARRIVRNLEACISATQLGITFCGMATGAVVKPVFSALLGPLFDLLGVDSSAIRSAVELVVGFLVSTILLIVIGELVPKTIAIRKPLGTSVWVAQPLEWFYRLTFPLIWLLNHCAQWFLGFLGIQPVHEADASHSEEEIKLLFASSHRQSGGSLYGRDIVLNALELRRRVAREVMRPRREIVGLSTEATIAECLDIAEKTRYSRFPLCEGGDIDRTLGVVHIKDLFAMRLKARKGAELVSVCRKLIYIPETARLEKLLQLFLDRKLHLALVVDEYGSTVGMVTLENIVEEIVGQIQDEFDQEKPLLTKKDALTWEVDGSLALHDLSEVVHEPLAGDGITTVSGWITQRLGGFPKVGDAVALADHDLVVEAVDGLRVSRLKLTRRADSTGPASPAA